MELFRIRLLQRLARLAYPRDSVRTVLRGPARGMRFLVGPAMGVSYALANDAMHFRLLGSRVAPGMTIWDAGSNLGQMALFFAKLVGAKGSVHAFEPMPHLARRARENAALNNFTHLHVHEAALSDSTGKARFEFDKNRFSQGKLQNVEPGAVLENPDVFDVQTYAVDDLIEQGLPCPDVMKIDIEGGAAMLFRGAQRLLDSTPPHIYIEVHGIEEQSAVRDELGGRGYTLQVPGGEVVRDPTLGWYSPMWCTPPSQ